MKTTTIACTAAVFLATFSISAQGGATRNFGAGCPSGRVDAGGWAPHPGLGSLSIFSFNRRPSTPVVGTLGANRRDRPLDFLSLRGCSLYNDLTVSQPGMANRDGRCSIAWPVPANPALAGADLYAQVIGLRDSRVSPLGLTLSSGVAMRIGPAIVPDRFQLRGDPRQPNGAPFTYRSVDGGVPFDLVGKLFVPTTPKPAAGFPAVIVTHGGGGSVGAYSSAMSRRMVQWGLVCIAINTAAADAPLGSPGSRLETGGFPISVKRVLKCVDILRSLGSIDMTRLAAHGNSNGGQVTAAMMAAVPGVFRAASHTAAGIDDSDAPKRISTATAGRIRTPYLMQHGDQDTGSPIQMDRDLAAVLAGNSVPHRFIVWVGRGHEVGGANSPVLTQMLANVRAWFVQHGVL